MNSPEERYRPTVRALAEEVRAQHGGAAALLIMRAYGYAADHHAGEFRRNGDPYLAHCVAVARIVAQVRLDHDLIAAALLHDVLDQNSSEEHCCRLGMTFGSDVVALVIAVATMDRQVHPPTPPESLDSRVVLLKLADRLHNLRTIAALKRERQLSKAQHTLDVLVPLAERIGNPLSDPLERMASQTITGQSHPQHGPRTARRTLSAKIVASAGLLLPAATRHRWVDEWRAELATISRPSLRFRFALDVVLGVPSLAFVTRNGHAGETS